jgi:hypothetical protein
MRVAALLVLAVAIACSVEGTAGPPWVGLYRGETGFVYVDTSRIAVSPAGTRVWLRVDGYAVEDPELKEVELRAVQQLEVRCESRQARDLSVDFDPATGGGLDLAGTARWQTFDDHMYGRYVLPRLCRILAQRAAA